MAYTKPTSHDLRRANQSEILRKIYFEGPISRYEISQQTGISPATVTNIVAGLITRDILTEAGLKPSEGGRPMALLQINPGYGYFIGIEVGETFIVFDLFSINFQRLGQHTISLTDYRIEPGEMVALLVAGIESVLKDTAIHREQVIGVGIGFPGLVDPERGVSVFTPNWGWHDVSIAALLEERLAMPMYLDNGAKAMAVAEMLFGAGQGVQNLIVLLVGTGVGSGVITNRKLFRGVSNNAGEFGHTTLNLNGPPCRCGSRGCLEVYVGATGIIRRYSELNPNTADVIGLEQITGIEEIIRRADWGENAARTTLYETVQYLGAGIANLINAYNTQLLLLGGWSGTLLGKKYLAEIREVVARYALEQSLKNTEIKLCQLGRESVAMGAAALALEHFFETAGENEGIRIGGEVI